VIKREEKREAKVKVNKKVSNWEDKKKSNERKKLEILHSTPRGKNEKKEKKFEMKCKNLIPIEEQTKDSHGNRKEK